MARQYLTPPSVPAEEYCRTLRIPNSPEWIGTLTGVLYPLCFSESWTDESGGITPEAAAERFTEIFNEMFEGDGECDMIVDCDAIYDCMLPVLSSQAIRDGDIRINPVTEEPEVSYDGGTTWTPIAQTGTPYRAPGPQPTPGVSAGAKRCLASTRAALVISEFYAQTFGAFTAGTMNVLGTINQFLNDVNTALFNLVYSPYEGVLEAAGWLDFDFETNFTAPGLDETAVAALTCLLLDNSSMDGDVVVFDFGAVYDNVIAELGANPGVAVTLLLSNMQSAGLQSASVVNVTSEGDCDCGQEWCYEWSEFSEDWTQSKYNFAGYSLTYITKKQPFTWPGVTKIRIEYNGPAQGSGTRGIILNGSYVLKVPSGSQPAGNNFMEWTGSARTATSLTMHMDSPGSNNFQNITRIVIAGEGPNPVGDDNCE